MLTKTTYAENSVVSFKLATGEEIIARVKSETDTKFELAKPMLLMPSQQGMGLIPAMISVNAKDQTIELNKSHVIMHSPTNPDIARDYTKGTSGLEFATPGLKL